jgi:hypothetical protein
MPRALPATSLLLLLLAAACGPGSSDEAYVLLDPHARQSGFRVEVDGEARSSPLPIAVALTEGAGAVLTSAERREALDLEPGELAYIRGENGIVTRGTPDMDQIRLLGDETSVREFAARVGVSPAADGLSRWLLRRDDILPIAALFDDAGVKDVFSSQPLFLSMSTYRGPDLGDARAAVREAGEPGSRFEIDVEKAETMELLKFRAMKANGTAGRSPEELDRDRAEILRDLELKLAVSGPLEVPAGEAIPLQAELVNRGLAERWLIAPDDGSSVGWREPYVFYLVTREVEPGVWVDADKESYGRCGNYDVRWDEDLVALPPGGVMKLDREILPLHYKFNMQAPGRYRITAHYQYTGGAQRRGLFAFGETVEMPPELFGTPSFEVVSNPVEITVTRAVTAGERRE